jgi:mannose-6-phosphate isomerase-like protein (cupin superfamily)
MPKTFRATDTVLHLAGPGPIPLWDNDGSSWDPTDRLELNSGQVLSVFTYSKTWDYQECHPDGEEVALVLTGDVDLLLDDGDGEVAIRVESGSGSVVPTGTWHRIAPRESSTVLFITPAPARTEHRHAGRPEMPE